MKDEPVKAIFFGKEVFVHPMMEKLRESECLCLNCSSLKPAKPDNCHIAQSLYEICLRENVALAITRCPLWRSK